MPKILLVEDNEMNRDMLSRRLERKEFDVVIAVDGQAGVNMATSESPDLILMDVQMPTMNGLEATAAIRSLEKQTGRHVPIVAMTAHAIKGDRERCLEAGMDEYVSKPIRSRQLFETLASVLSTVKRSTAGGKSTEQ